MNIPSINDVQFLSDAELEALPLDVLGVLHGDAVTIAAQIAQNKKRVVSAVENKFHDEIANLTTGTVKVVRGGVEVAITRPKRVEWDQIALDNISYELQDLGFDPFDAIEVKLSVPEKKYNEVPTAVRMLLESARTVKASSTSLKFRDLENRGTE